MSLFDIDPHLCNQAVSHGKLCQCIACNRELTNTDDTNPKLRQSENAAGKLSDGKYAFGRDRSSVWSVFKRDVEPGHTTKGCLRFVLKPPPVPFFFCGERSPALRASHSLLGNIVLAFSTRFHSSPALPTSLTFVSSRAKRGLKRNGQSSCSHFSTFRVPVPFRTWRQRFL
jgi:hypothetical protein